MTKDIEKATLQDYGYRDYRILKKAFKISMKCLVILSVFMLYLPIILIAIQSINSKNDTFSFGSISFKAYAEIFNHRLLTRAIKNTLIISFFATILSTVAGTLVAVGISALKKKTRKQIMIFNNVPLLNADIVSGFTLMLMFYIFLFPIFPRIFGFPTLILAHMFFTLPYVILSVLPKLGEIDENLMDAALDLGIKPYKALIKVVIPAIKAGIFSGMLLAFTMSIDDFVISFFTSGNGVDNLSTFIYSSLGKRSLKPSVYAFTTLLTLGTLGVLLLINKISAPKDKKREKALKRSKIK